jgi:hypothetical protein
MQKFRPANAIVYLVKHMELGAFAWVVACQFVFKVASRTA